MKRSLFCLIVLLAISCKPNPNQENVSDPDFVESEDGRMLILTPGSAEGSVCVLSLDKDNPANTELVNHSGGFDKSQLREVILHMGIPRSLIDKAVGDIMEVLKEKPSRTKNPDIQKFTAIAIYGYSAEAGKVLYRMIIGNYDYDDSKTFKEKIVTAGTIFWGRLVIGPIVELIRKDRKVTDRDWDRRDREVTDRVIVDVIGSQADNDEKNIQRVSDQKMEEIISNIKDMPTELSGSCNYLK